MAVRSWVSGAAAVAFVAALAPQARAEAWNFQGARYQGMGGAGVAVVDDVHASHWNPGALAFDHSSSIELPFSFETSTEGDILSEIDRIARFVDDNALAAVLTKVQTGQGLTALELQDLLQLAAGSLPALQQEGEGFLSTPDLGLSLQHGRMVLTLKGRGSLGIDPVLDLGNLGFSDDVSAAAQVTNVVAAGADRSGAFTNGGSQSLADALAASLAAWSQNQAEELVFQAELAALDTSAAGVRDILTRIATDTGALTALDLASNGSGAVVSGLLTQEIGLGYAHPLLGNSLGIGGHVRYIHGTTYSQFLRYDAISSGEDLIRELRDFRGRESSDRVAVDLGVLLRPHERWRIGVVGRNLNAPEFATRSPDDFTLDAQARAGIALNLLPTWVVSADVDLTENESETLDGFHSRLLSLGTEFRLGSGEKSVAIRAGAFTNLAGDPSASLTLTGGIGIRIWRLGLDLAVAAAPDLQDIEVDGTKLPSHLNVSGALKWEGSF